MAGVLDCANTAPCQLCTPSLESQHSRRPDPQSQLYMRPTAQGWDGKRAGDARVQRENAPVLCLPGGEEWV